MRFDVRTLALFFVLLMPAFSFVAKAAAGFAGAGQQATDESTARFQLELGRHGAPIRGLALTADGKFAVTVSGDKSARVWQLADRSIRQVFRPADGGGRDGTLYAVAAHPTTDLVAVAGAVGDLRISNQILLFSPSSARFIRAIEAGPGEITRLKWTADGEVLLATYRNGHGLRAFDEHGVKIFEHADNGSSYGLAVHQSGAIVSTSYRGRVYQYAYANNRIRLVRQFESPTPAPRGVAFSPDGTRFAISYRGKAGNQGAPTVHSTSTGKLLVELPRPRVDAGNLATVVFETENTLLAGGSAYPKVGEHRVYRYDIQAAKIVGQAPVATNTITDMARDQLGEILFTAFDGTWGQIDRELQTRTASGPLADFRGPDNLRITSDGRRVGLNYQYGGSPLWFDFDKRVLHRGELPAALAEPVTRRGLFSRDNWENTRQPEVFGKKIRIAPDEVSRSIAYYDQNDRAILGTSRQLIAIDSTGNPLWSAQAPAEVWSVNIVGAASVAVGALADGTIRWWDVQDGSLLLSLLVLPDRRWLIWTPDGRFDSSAGADRLAGWALNRTDQPVADFVSLNRLRKRFRSPDLFETVVLRKGKTNIATTNNTMFLPPIIRAEGDPSIDLQTGQLLLPFSIDSASPDLSLEVRIDGRPVEPAGIRLTRESDNRSVGQVELSAPNSDAVVQLIARSETGISEPLSVRAIQTDVSSRPAPQAFEPVPALPEQLKPLDVLDQPPEINLPAGNRAKRPDEPGQTLYALAIGISQYQRPSYRLRLAAKDASDMASALATAQGADYDFVQTRLLTDENATAAQIQEGLNWLQQSVGADDLGILFIAGHGLNDQNGEYYFLPWEGQHEALQATGIAESTLRNTLAGMKGRALLFIDTCYAGGAIGTFRSASRELAALANNLAASENGVIVFASSTGRQLSEENDAWGNGAFTKAVIDGLSGKADFNRSGRITYKALDFYVSDVVSKLTDGRQTPVTLSPVGIPDFSIVSRVF